MKNHGNRKEDRQTSRKISQQIAKDFGIQASLVRDIIQTFIYGVAQGIAEGKEVCVDGLGIFKARKVQQARVIYCKGRDEKAARFPKAAVRVSFRRSQRLGVVLRQRWLSDEERGR